MVGISGESEQNSVSKGACTQSVYVSNAARTLTLRTVLLAVHRSLKSLDDGTRNCGLACSWLTSHQQEIVLALEESGQMFLKPQTGEFLIIKPS